MGPGFLLLLELFSTGLPGYVGTAGQDSPKQADDSYDQLLHRDHPQLKFRESRAEDFPWCCPRYPPLLRA
jgi:hypothetical protein